eukprot:jgi/Orpsp1_1/1185733/evm.model.c7180000094998.1
MAVSTKHLWVYCGIACLGGVIYGWEVGMLNIVFSMRSTYGVRFGLWEFKGEELVPTSTKNIKESIITPMFTFGCMIGSVFAMTIADKIGRTKPLALGSFIYAIGAAIQTFSNAVTVFCVGRFIAGIACGLSMVVSPIYIAEISTKEARGMMGMLYNLVIQFGFLFASLCDTLSLKFIKGEVQWRVAVGCQFIPAVLFILLVWFAPETPRYLLLKNKEDKALNILSKVREKPEDDKEIVEEFTDMRDKLKVELVAGIASWKELFENKRYFYRIVIASGLQFLHMLVGVNALNYYSSQIYSNYLGIDIAKYGAWLIVLSNLIVAGLTIPGVKYVEKAGRRKLLLFGAVFLALSMFFIFIFCYILDKHSKSTLYGILCVLFIYAFCSVYSCTWGSTVWVWQTEIFPLRTRSRANAICAQFQYLGSALITGTTSIIMKHLKYYTFLIFVAMCVIAFFFTLFLVKETKGLRLEDTDKLYSFDKKYYEKNEKEAIAEKHAMEAQEKNAENC